MTDQLLDLLETYLNVPRQRTLILFQRFLMTLAAITFVLFATLIVAFDDVFVGLSNSIDSVEVGKLAPRDINAPGDTTFISQVLTEDARETARQSVQPIYDPPDPNISRQQTALANQILVYIKDVRRDPYGTIEQKMDDLGHITALTLDERIIDLILKFDDDTWADIESEILNLLPFVMSQSIRQPQLQSIQIQLPIQVSVRFNPQERDVIVALVEDLVRPNTFENVEETETARDRAAENVSEISRTFIRGERVVEGDQMVTAADYEALRELGLLKSEDLRIQEIMQAFLASVVVMVISGLYLARFNSSLLYRDTRMLMLVATIFILMLLPMRFLGVSGNVYLFPSAAMALLYVAITGPHVAIITTLGLALLTGLMIGGSLEVVTLITAGGIIGTLTLRRAERLNAFFVTGLLIAAINAAVIGIFQITSPAGDTTDTTTIILIAMLSGALLVPATAIAVMYVVSMAFNLPTALKLLDLSQPGKPLLQRLLREAPGTYQHSLQVANLAEQAATAIGADAGLTHVAALYHDIGKMMNPVYFTENQQDIANPHDALNDPYRSADIIIGHVTEGDDLARQYHLPGRLRDFIREHHGTTQVYVFYQRAINQAGGEEAAVDASDFSYPGPKPRSKETAILMLADSCEAAVRSVKPKSKQEIRDLVEKIIDDKRKHGQLSQSGLTLNDLYEIRRVFVDLLQGMFHPRINYREAVDKKPGASSPPPPATAARTVSRPAVRANSKPHATGEPEKVVTGTRKRPAPVENGDSKPEPAIKKPVPEPTDEDEPMTEVPRLPRAEDRRHITERRTVRSFDYDNENGSDDGNRDDTSNNHADSGTEKEPADETPETKPEAD